MSIINTVGYNLVSIIDCWINFVICCFIICYTIKISIFWHINCEIITFMNFTINFKWYVSWETLTIIRFYIVFISINWSHFNRIINIFTLLLCLRTINCNSRNWFNRTRCCCSIRCCISYISIFTIRRLIIIKFLNWII